MELANWAVMMTALRTLAARTVRHLRRLASGERAGVSPATQRVLQHLFRCSLGELLAPFGHEELVSAPAGSAHRGVALLDGDPDKARKVIDVAAERAKKFGLVASRNAMTDETMEQVHEDVRELALTYPQRPLHEILGRLADTQDTVFSLLEQRNRPTHSRQLYYAADALAWLPSEVAAAEDYAGQAVAAYRDPASPDWAFGDQAGSHSDLAVARIMAGELEGATEALSPVLDLPPAQRNNGIIRSVHHVHTALTRSGLASDSRELQEHIEVFSRVPVASLPQ